MAERRGFFVCTVLSDIIAVQDKFAEPVRRNRIILFGLQPHAFLFISFFLFFKIQVCSFSVFESELGNYLLYTISQYDSDS